MQDPDPYRYLHNDYGSATLLNKHIGVLPVPTYPSRSNGVLLGQGMKKSVTLLDWINQAGNSSLEQVADSCYRSDTTFIKVAVILEVVTFLLLYPVSFAGLWSSWIRPFWIQSSRRWQPVSRAPTTSR
jgi:hypothetical protein